MTHLHRVTHRRPPSRSRRRDREFRAWRPLSTCLGVLCLASSAAAQNQVVFSIDYRGASISMPSTTTVTPITESDVMRAAPGFPALGPLPSPTIVLTGQQLGLLQYSQCVGHPAGQPCRVEVDALSFGRDARMHLPGPPGAPPPAPLVPGQARIYFSVDRFATGLTGTGVAPNVRSEGATGAGEAGADVFTPYTTLVGPIAPSGAPGPNVGVFDGNGLISTSGKRYRGFGLREPTTVPPPYDDLDALDMGPAPTGPGAAVYFSLDAAFVDPLLGTPNTDSAGLQGVPPSAVLKRLLAGGGVTIYATPAQLGLSPTADDLDALVLAENGDGLYQPSVVFYDWDTGATDMLLFSVRRGSAVIGLTDSLFGAPIEAGDILAPPAVAGSRPRIFIPAEALGLATERSSGAVFGDELDAFAMMAEPYNDCNNNGQDDAVDIATGTSADTNNNGIPDECEQTYSTYCFCPTPLGPCGNDSATTGCLNSTGSGGLLTPVGTTSVATDDMELSGTGLPPNSMGLFFMGASQTQVAFGDGLRCIPNPLYRIGIQAISGTGTVIKGPGIAAYCCSHLPPAGCISSGQTWNFQLWYRNAAAFCTSATYNLTNGVNVTFSP